MKELKIIKVGGKAAEDEAVLNAFLDDFTQLEGLKILVHGGGVIATDLADKLGVKTTMIEGRRVTDKEMLDVTTMVYAGLVNKNIVAKLQTRNVNAIGLTGADLNCMYSKKRPSKPIDFGWVGDIESVQTEWLVSFLDKEVVSVIAPLTHDGEGHLLNTNADSMASFLASALSEAYSVHLYSLFDREGVMKDGEVIQAMTPESYSELRSQGMIKGGMIPKLDLGFLALQNGVKEVILKGFDALSEKDKGTRLSL